MSCVFCDSLTTEAHRIIYKDDKVFVIVNIEPLKDGHVMILPVRHAELMGDLDEEESKAFLHAAERCMKAVTEVYKETPMFMVNGWSFRTQPHLHGHVLPSKNHLRGLYNISEGVDARKLATPEFLSKMANDLKPYFEEGL